MYSSPSQASFSRSKVDFIEKSLGQYCVAEILAGSNPTLLSALATSSDQKYDFVSLILSVSLRVDLFSSYFHRVNFVFLAFNFLGE